MGNRNRGNGGKSKSGKNKRNMDNKPHPPEKAVFKPLEPPTEEELEQNILNYEHCYGFPRPSMKKDEINDDMFPTDTWKPVVIDTPFPIDHCKIMRSSPLSMDKRFDQKRINLQGGNNFMN